MWINEKDKLIEVSWGKRIAADVSTAIIKANDAREVAVTSAWQAALFLLDEVANHNKLIGVQIMRIIRISVAGRDRAVTARV